ncbi:hypothetical protein CTheo_6953 [Ceratobasidium theobromae]|uniref:Oxidoreductase n=1 Tax=Ceratobasidium theobromae TaxID=1582974 RepID=A0A5N5QDR9_9AGAM|nr:hypothetical protein CTheo_6953 [Ceratobasidium theobromae]
MTVPPSSPVVLVTGSSHGGIGYSICEVFAARGCTVYATARRLESVSTFNNPFIRPLVMDVTSDESVHKAVEHIVEEAGRIDIAVANAGMAGHSPILDMPINLAKRVLDTNTIGVLRLAQAVFPHMAARKRGTFVTIGSVVGYTTTPWSGMYAASKAGAHAITEALQMEARALSPNIHVMLVIPGGVKSNIAKNAEFELPETSLFKAYLPCVLDRIHLSQADGTMPTVQFADGLVKAVLRRGGPPRLFAYGNRYVDFMEADVQAENMMF